ncbi:hypothetical protein SBA6_1380006 [Candidatus Sulfopaludibacter sp. SbA6]|nr:hypothetical protein SBA6_1380006 [Candidatus Sulfopaludibacter sp. SbA6]
MDIIEGCGRCASSGIRSKGLRDFPKDVRHDAGYQLDKVQRGDQPDDFKPMHPRLARVWRRFAFRTRSAPTG